MQKQYTEKSAPPGGLTASTALSTIVVSADDRANDFIVLADLIIEDLLLLIRVAVTIA